MVTVRLDRATAEKAATEAIRRRLDCRDGENRDLSWHEGNWDIDINGAMAEQAAIAAMRQVEGWSVTEHAGAGFKAPDLLMNNIAGDSFPIRVHTRSTVRDDGCLIIHEWDYPDSIAILVTGSYPAFKIRGGVWLPSPAKGFFSSPECKRYLRFNPRGPTAFIPQRLLIPPDRLLAGVLRWGIPGMNERALRQLDRPPPLL